MSRLAAAFLFLAGIVHVVLGIGAVAGTERLEENVREISTSDVGGELYLSLGNWGLVMGVAGALELASAGSLASGGRHARLFGLVAGFLAMGVVFLSLPIFRWPAAATLVLLFAATYVLAYRVREEAETSE